VEIKNEVATLFTPAGFSSSSASATYVHCEDLEIIDATTGSAPLTLKVLKRYGTSENLGQIKSCGERLKPEAAPVFLKGPNVFNAEYVKPGSPERRRLDVFESADGQNYYMLVVLPAILCLATMSLFPGTLCWFSLSMRRRSSGTGGSKHTLFMKTKP
jgi:hypothetical protein